jgi:large subunit ribosomal protein L29
MKPAEIRAMDDTNVSVTLTKLHEEWRDLRFKEAVGQLTETARIREIRKTIAQIHTIRTEREFAAAVEAGQLPRQRKLPKSKR